MSSKLASATSPSPSAYTRRSIFDSGRIVKVLLFFATFFLCSFNLGYHEQFLRYQNVVGGIDGAFEQPAIRPHVFEQPEKRPHDFRPLDIEVVNEESRRKSNKMSNQDDCTLNIAYQLNPGAHTSFARKKEIRPWRCGYRIFPYPSVQLKHHKGTSPLHAEMRPFFNFTTSIQTNLKLLFMGDSVGDQLALYIESMMRWDKDNKNTLSSPLIVESIHSHNKEAKNAYVTAPLDPHHNCSKGGGGALAFIRLIAMFLGAYEGWATPEWSRGWTLGSTQTIREYVSNVTSTQKESQNRARKKTIALRTLENTTRKVTVGSDESGNFDAFVFRIPSPGWIAMNEVTIESIQETIDLAHQLFGFRVVVFLSMHYVNDVDEYIYSREDMHRKNQELFDFARNWTETHGQDRTNSGVHSIYVLDYARLNDELLEWNARLLGFDIEHGDFTEDKVLITTKTKKTVQKSVAHACGEKVPHGSRKCEGNAISADGLHLCMNTVGPRLTAGLACQLQCAFPVAADDEWACAQACNDRFMSLKGR